MELSSAEIYWIKSVAAKAIAKVSAQKARIERMSFDDPHRVFEERVLTTLEQNAAVLSKTASADQGQTRATTGTAVHEAPRW
jgi:hypothetical protein